MLQNTSDIRNIQNHIKEASNRIKDHLVRTPIMVFDEVNKLFGAKVYFKVESLQHTGAFKVRGALNHLLKLKERGSLPDKIVAYSTGNHGIATSWCAKQLKIKGRIYLPENVSPYKINIMRDLGADIVITKTRKEAEIGAANDKEQGYYFLHPSSHDDTIYGASTLTYEALLDLKEEFNVTPNAIFASCGGGGLISGTYLAVKSFSHTSKVFGVEPEIANDSYKSFKSGQIFRFENSPNTIADGLRTLGLSEKTFSYIRNLDDIILVSEEEILKWTIYLNKLFAPIKVEPSCAINLNAVEQWLKGRNAKEMSPPVVLIMISGGNIQEGIY